VSSAERLPALDGLRAISILLVLATHMLPVGPKLLRLNETTGPMGMSLFFALSGFLIVSGLRHNPDVNEFVIRRFARIVPLAYLYALLVFSVVQFSPSDMLWTASFVENYFPAHLNSYNAHFWSLCIEMQFYCGLAVALACFGEKALWAVWPACLAITAMRISQGEYAAIQTHLRADEILAGACVATLYRPSWSGRARYHLVLAAVTALLWFISSSPFSGWCQYLRPYATASLLTVVLCLGDSALKTLLSSAPMRYVAKISYALYVVHPLTIQGWWNDGTIFERYILKRPISFLMTFAAAHLSTFYWERLWQQAAKQWIERRRMHRWKPQPRREIAARQGP
jgi:peptidoglycan/LPS O-acetylase OafA/YrhL